MEFCNCEKQDKVPQKEIPFLQDQLGPRMMVVGGIDEEEETIRLQNKKERQDNDTRRREMSMKND